MNLPHAPSLYAASADPAPAFPRLREDVRADVAIIGGGYTGLSAALHLAEAGVSAVVIEANSVGWGASGRNGGQLHTGQRRDQDWLEAKLGRDEAKALWRLAEEAKALTLGLIARHRIDCDWRAGLIETVHKARLVADERAYVDMLGDDYGYAPVEWLDRERSRRRPAPATITAAGSTAAPAISTRSSWRKASPAPRRGPGPASTRARARSAHRRGGRRLRLECHAAMEARVAMSPRRGRARDGQRGAAARSGGAPSRRGEGLRRHRHPRRQRLPPRHRRRDRGAGHADRQLHSRHRADRRRQAGRHHPRRRGGLRHPLRRLLFPPDLGRPADLRRRRDLFAAPAAGSRRLRPPAHAQRLSGARRDPDRACLGRDAGDHPEAACPSSAASVRASMPRLAIRGRGWRLPPFAGKVIADAIRGDPARLDRFAALPVPPSPAAGCSATRRWSPA